MRRLITMRKVLIGVLLSSTAAAQATTMESVPTNGYVCYPSRLTESRALSGDGRWIAFHNESAAYFPFPLFTVLRDRWADTYEPLALDLTGQPVKNNCHIDAGALSHDGRWVVFAAGPDNLVANDSNGIVDIVVRDRALEVYELASVGPGGVQTDNWSTHAVITDDGRFVAFTSRATTLAIGDANGLEDVFVRDRHLGVTERISVALGASDSDGMSQYPSLTSDGRFVCFESRASNLVIGDTNAANDVFLRDRAAGTTTVLSTPTGSVHPVGGWKPWIAKDGSSVAFGVPTAAYGYSGATLGVVALDLTTSALELVSLDPAGVPIFVSDRSMLSADGRFVVFNDGHTEPEVYRRDRALQRTELASVRLPGKSGNAMSSHPHVSDDGRLVAFTSNSKELVNPMCVPNSSFNLFVRDFDGPATTPIAYGTSKLSSESCSALIGAVGVASASGLDTFRLVGELAPRGRFGCVVWGVRQASTPFGGGTLYVQLPARRTQVADSGGNFVCGGCVCSGAWSFAFTHEYMRAHGLAPGTTVYSQILFRDPGFDPPNDVGLTDALAWTLAP
ncbi:MAG: hypothetical protein HZA52_02350 [Planctomycetes bacterium]|nr:hypothetical protein [Planctomycetota bacterium]